MSVSKCYQNLYYAYKIHILTTYSPIKIDSNIGTKYCMGLISYDV